jgi:hypothetical protein
MHGIFWLEWLGTDHKYEKGLDTREPCKGYNELQQKAQISKGFEKNCPAGALGGIDPAGEI